MRRSVVLLGLMGALAAGAALAATESHDDEFVVASGNAADARNAALSDRFLVVWTDSSGISKDVRGRIYRAGNGEPLGPSFVVAGTADDEVSPEVAAQGDEFLVVWTRVTGMTPYGAPIAELRSTRLSKAGTVIQPGGIVVVPAQTPACERLVAVQTQVASNENGWLVVWVEICDGSEPAVVGTRLSTAGVLLNAEPFDISGGVCGNPHVSAIGSKFLVTFDAYDPDTTGASLIEIDGTLLRRVMLEDDYLYVQSIASDGTDFRMTFLDWPTTSSVYIDGSTLFLREETREQVSEPMEFETPFDYSSIAYENDRWLIAHVEPGSVGTDVFFDDVRLFAGARFPRIAATGDVAMVTAARGDAVIARIFDVGHVASATPLPPGPTPSPTATVTATPSPTPTATLPPRSEADTDGDGSDSVRCSLTLEPGFGSIVPAIVAGFLVMVRRRARSNIQR